MMTKYFTTSWCVSNYWAQRVEEPSPCEISGNAKGQLKSRYTRLIFQWYSVSLFWQCTCRVCVGWNAGLCVLFFHSRAAKEERNIKWALYCWLGLVIWNEKKKEKIELSTYTVLCSLFFTIVVVLKNYMSIFWTKKYSFCFVVSIQRSYILKNIIKSERIKKILKRLRREGARRQSKTETQGFWCRNC